MKKKEINSLEDYSVYLFSHILLMDKMCEFHGQAVEAGLLKEDMLEFVNLLLWDIKRMIKNYENHLQEVMRLFPDDFDQNKILDIIAEKSIQSAKNIIEKSK